MSAEMTYVNEFVARGIVLNIGWNEYRKTILTLLVKERRGNVLKLDINLETNTNVKIGKKDRVIVTGYTRGFNYHNDSLRKDSEVMFFVGTSVEKETTELAKRFGGDIGTFYPEPVFRSFVAGKVIKSIPPTLGNNWAKLIIETAGGGNDMRASRFTLRYYTGGRLPVFDYQEGDVICARLSAYTPEKKINEAKTIRFQNLNVEDIAYLYKSPRKAEKTIALDVDCGLIPAATGLHGFGIQKNEQLANKESVPDVAESREEVTEIENLISGSL